MDTQAILRELTNERDHLDAAIVALEGKRKKLGRPKGTGKAAGAGKRRRMSAAARRRISESQKRSWAARKKTAG